MIRRIFAAVAAFSFTFPTPAHSEASEAEYRRHVEILASENFQGRRPGTIGEAVAAHYITAQFAEAGLRPGWKGSFYQPVELIERRPIQATGRWAGGGRSGEWSEDDLLLTGSAAHDVLTDEPVVYAGYGIEEDYGALRSVIEGAIVVIRAGAPEGVPAPPRASSRIEAMADAGAKAVIVIAESDEDWEQYQRYFSAGSTTLEGRRHAVIDGYASPDAGRTLLRAAGYERDVPDAPVALDLTMSLDVATEVQPYTGYNVVGRLAGSAGGEEAVVFMAHYDHFGVCRPGEEDAICNGAFDNASGTAALIAVADALGEGPRPARDIYFVATTAEELGLLGAEAWADDPSLPLDRLVAALNLDTIAIGPRGAPVGIVGRGMTALDPIVDGVARQLGREIYDSEDPNAFVRRQDGWVLLERGVPSIMAGGSFTDYERLNAFLQGPYHGPDDNFDDTLELGGAYEDVLLHIALGRALADPARYSPEPR